MMENRFMQDGHVEDRVLYYKVSDFVGVDKDIALKCDQMEWLYKQEF